MIVLSKGNMKLQDLFLIFNLPTGLSCIGNTPLCTLWCYAKKAERLHPAVRPSRERNFVKSKEPAFVDDMIDAIITTRGTKKLFFRINESGDFYSQEYFDKWCKIAQQITDMVFFAYTKNYELDISQKPDHFRLYYSVFPDTNLELVPKQGLRAYTYGWKKKIYYTVNDSPRFDEAFICDDLKCAECRVCFEQDLDVKFPFH